jgi:hypothetical protein
MPSLSSANAGSSVLSNASASSALDVMAFCELRSEAREDGRRGVVGREGRRVRDVEREQLSRRIEVGVVAMVDMFDFVVMILNTFILW